MLTKAVAYSSNVKYGQDWRRWRRFFGQCWEDPTEEDLYMQQLQRREQVEMLIAYGMYCMAGPERPLAASTVISSYSGIRHSFRSNMLPMEVFDDRSLRAFKTAITLEERRVRADDEFTSAKLQKFPMTLGMVLDVAAEARRKPGPDEMMTATAIQLAFMCLLRVSEYAPRGNKDEEIDDCHAILTRDVNFEVQDDDGMPTMVSANRVTQDMWPRITQVRFTLRHMKNDRFRMGNTFWYGNTPGTTLNIVKVVFDWAVKAKSGITDKKDFFFSYQTKSNRTKKLTQGMVSRTIKRCAMRFNLDPRDYGTHSPRIGGACTLRAGGASQTWLAEIGRWAEGSKAILTYQETSEREMAMMQQILQDESLFTTSDIRTIHKKSTRLSYSFNSIG